MTEPGRYCDWCKARLEWDDDRGCWTCTNPDCDFNTAGNYGGGLDSPKRPND